MCVCVCIHTQRSEEQLLAFWRAATAFLQIVGLFCGYTGLFCGYTGLFWENIESCFADEQTPYIHRPLLQKKPTQQRLILKTDLTIHYCNCNTLQHTATHCNTLHHTTSYCNILQHSATHCNSLQHTATHCNTLQYSATHCNTLQHTQ